MKKIKSFSGFMIIFTILFLYFINKNSELLLVATELNNETVEIPSGYDIPSVKFSVSKKNQNTWLLTLDTKNFTIAPDDVCVKLPNYHIGHAHLYINGKKITNIYKNEYTINTLKNGSNEVKISLHIANHAALAYKGTAIESTAVINVSS